MFEIANDCDILVEKFSKSGDLRFASFARLCNASNLAPILTSDSEELPLLASELLATAKAIILNVNKEFASRIGGLYLMYGLYFTQKSKSKVRLTFSEFKEFTKFTSELKEKKIMDVEFIFQKLFIGKAFLFCACSTPNKFIQMNQKCQSSEEEIVNPMDENECRLIGCEGLSSNSLRNVDLAHCKYEEKKQIAGFITTPSSAAPSQHFPDEIRIILDDTDSEIAEMKSNGIKQGESTSDSGVVINQGVIRRGIVNSSFSQIRSRRMPVDVTSYDLTRKTKSKPDDSGNH